MATGSLSLVSKTRCFGGYVNLYSHASATLGCDMQFRVYLPPAAESGSVPALYYLSGLTCTSENMITKGHAQEALSQHGIAMICPDTSPRGLNLPGEDDAYDFGSGAGFYVNATEEPWATNYKMYDYVTKELPDLVAAELPIVGDNVSVFGHSMGGHGALILALKNPGMFKSVSAFAPICNPTQCPWGEKAFGGYLGGVEKGVDYDATELAKGYAGPALDVLIDQGSEDGFLKEGQLLPEAFTSAAGDNAALNVEYNLREGYDHSYYFISTFAANHVAWHAQHLNNTA